MYFILFIQNFKFNNINNNNNKYCILDNDVNNEKISCNDFINNNINSSEGYIKYPKNII